MSETATAVAKCTRCGRMIETCVCCDEPTCTASICYRCLNLVLRSGYVPPHMHGG